MRTLLDRPNIIHMLQSLRFWWNNIGKRRKRKRIESRLGISFMPSDQQLGI
jgi:hypothetical protein